MTQAKRNKIAPVSIFFLLYISRLVVSLTDVQSVTAGEMKTDTLISILISMLLTLLLSLPAVMCCIKNKSPFDIKWTGLLYSLYFIFLAGVNISRFSYFASTTLNPDSQAWIFSVIIVICACYGAYLGIEGLARFSAFGFALLTAAIIIVLLCSAGSFQEINLYPVISNNTDTILKNIVYMTSSSSESVLFLCLCKRVNGKAVKPYIRSVIAAFFTIFILFLTVIGVMGDAASLQEFPLYTLFRLAKVGLLERIDILHISFWIFGIFIKSVLLIYCSAISFKPMKNRTKCIVSSALALVLAVCLTELVGAGSVSPVVYAVPFAVFCVIIPIMTLIFKKRNYGDELVERF